MTAQLPIEFDKTPSQIITMEGALDALLVKVDETLNGFVPDLSTAKSRKEITALSQKIVRTKTAIDTAGKDLTEEARKKLDAVNAVRKRARDELDKRRDQARKPLTDWEQEQADLQARRTKGLQRLVDLGCVGLLSGHIERSLIWQDRETGIWLKARPDVIPPIENTIVDLKTIGTSASDDDCQRAIGAHGYHMQLALVNMGMEAIFGRTVEEFILLFVETSAPYAYNLKPVDQRAIFLGECQIRRALRTLADCMERDHWPTYKGSGNHAYLPGWTQKTLEADLEGGLLPDVQNPITYGVAAE